MTIFCHQSQTPLWVSEEGISHPPGSVWGRMWCSFTQGIAQARNPSGAAKQDLASLGHHTAPARSNQGGAGSSPSPGNPTRAEARQGHGPMGEPGLRVPMARQSCGELETDPAEASIGQGLTALGR